MSIRRILLFILIINGLQLFSQVVQIERSEKVVEKDGREYFLHTIESGHTIYSISRVYAVSVEDILNANPVAAEDLSIGQVLYIPKKNDASEQSIHLVDTSDGNTAFVYHAVQPGQTLFAISKVYGVSVEEIKSMNPETAQGLKAGSRLKIPVENSPPVEKEGNEAGYSYHTVEKGETAYGIARKLNISLDDLYLLNPAVRNGLNPGMKIRFPKASAELNPGGDSLEFKQHKVRKNENLRTIADEYGVQVEDILNANPELEMGMGRLPRGTVLNIPKAGTREGKLMDTAKVSSGNAFVKNEPKGNDIPCFPDTNNLRANYEVVLMLPFYEDAVDTIRTDPIDAKEPSVYPSFRFIHFYEGVLLALDSLEKMGLRLELKVYDVGGDTLQVRRILKKESIKHADLIIGPLYYGSFRVVSDFAHDHRIPIVNPFTSREEVLKGKPRVYKAYPSERDIMGSLAGFILDTYPGAKLFVAGRQVSQEKHLHELFAKALNDAMELRNIPDSSWVDIISAGVNPAPFYSELQKDEFNIFIALSTDQVYVFNLLRKLYSRHEDHDIIVIGMPAWEKFSGLDPDYIQALNLHTYSKSWVDYSDAATREFIHEFRDEYHAEPDQYAFQGYDLAQFFIRGLMLYGAKVGDCMHHFEYNGLQTVYRFNREPGNGFSNSFSNIYRIKDYQQVDARRYPVRPGSEHEEE